MKKRQKQSDRMIIILPLYVIKQISRKRKKKKKKKKKFRFFLVAISI